MDVIYRCGKMARDFFSDKGLTQIEPEIDKYLKMHADEIVKLYGHGGTDGIDAHKSRIMEILNGSGVYCESVKIMVENLNKPRSDGPYRIIVKMNKPYLKRSSAGDLA